MSRLINATSPSDHQPSQVTDAMVEAATKELLAHGEFSSIPGNNEPNARIAARAALTAAIGAGSPLPEPQIEHMVQQFLRWKLPDDFNPDGGIQFVKQTDYGHTFEPVGTNLFDYKQAKALVLHMLEGLSAIGAGGQAVAEPIAYGVFSKHGDLSGFGPTAADAEASVEGGLWEGDYIAPLYTHPAPSGQAGMEDWQRVDDALVSCAGLLQTLCKDEIGDTAAAELEYVRSALSNPPAQPGWRMAPITPTQEMMDAADRARPLPESYVYEIWGSMLSAAPLPGGVDE